MNSVLVGMVETTEDGEIDPDTIIPMIDGGTEGNALLFARAYVTLNCIKLNFCVCDFARLQGTGKSNPSRNHSML